MYVMYARSVHRGLTLRADHQTPSLLGPSIDRLDDVNQLLLVLQYPVEFVVVARAEITHHVLVAEEEHECDRIVEFVHLLEVGHLVEIADVDDGEILDAVRDTWMYGTQVSPRTGQGQRCGKNRVSVR